MCDPVSISLGLSAATAVTSYAGMSASAEGQGEAVKRASQLQQMDLERQAGQQREAAAQQVNEQARAAQRDAALFDVIAGEYGGGNTADRTAAVARVQQGENLATMGRNAELASQENRFASLATTSAANARLASIQRPSLIGTALQIGGAAATWQKNDGAWLASRWLKGSPNTEDYRGAVLPSSLRGRK